MVLILISVCNSQVLAKSTGRGRDAESKELSSRVTTSSDDARGKALERKEQGDQYALQEDYKHAADEYMKALEVDPKAFNASERLKMAIAVSWADRLDDAIHVLRSILAEDPANRAARVHLARVLSWSDRLSEAEAEADTVLRDHPDDQEALLVKANVLRWRGDARASIPVYEKALAQGENFDVRLGLTNAYISTGDRKNAEENAKLLKPQYPYQEKELKKLDDAFCGVKTSRPALGYSYYHDSDHNIVNRYTLGYGLRLGTGEAGISYRLAHAKDPSRSVTAQDLLATANGRWGTTGAAAALGVSRPDYSAGDIAIGSARVDQQTGWGAIGISLSRELMEDTAQLIENRIVRTAEALFLSQNITQRTTLSESYAHASYSDSNHADDIRAGVRQAITLASPRVAAGYRFRYWNFERQSNGGYFDPNHFTSHQLFVALSAEQGGWYAYLEPSVGLQSFARNDQFSSSRVFYGVGASAGWTMKKCTSFEVYEEGGNYAGGTPAGFSYYLIGLSFKAYF
ncbi:MAG TPA: tetratricopeptide repeat protein [Nitrospirota bacterium]